MQEIRLATLVDSGLEERFADAMQMVLGNISDVNTPAEKTRSITIKINIKPSENRSFAETSIDVSAKLIPQKKLVTFLEMGTDGRGNFEAYEHNPQQKQLFEVDSIKTRENGSNVLTLNVKGA